MRRQTPMRHLHLPQALGPWSWRRFRTEEEAQRFHLRLSSGHPDPVCLTEDHVAPDGTTLVAGSWIVIYRPITF